MTLYIWENLQCLMLFFRKLYCKNMKYVFYFLMIIAACLTFYGIIYKEETVLINVYDIYIVIDYKYLGIFIGILVLGIAGLFFLFKKIRMALKNKTS